MEVDEVQAWVSRVLPGGGRGLRVLEVGCGPGVLAEHLLRDGVELTAIDVSEEQVAEARARGVPAIASDFLAFEAAPFDAVLFTRSLHHIAPLAAGIAKIRVLVRPGGLVLADEFAYDEESTRSPRRGSGTSRRCWRAVERSLRTCRGGTTAMVGVMDTTGIAGRTARRPRIRWSAGASGTSTNLRCMAHEC